MLDNKFSDVDEVLSYNGKNYPDPNIYYNNDAFASNTMF